MVTLRHRSWRGWGVPNAKLLYRWKQERVTQSGPVASSLEAQVRELENELRRVDRERMC